MTVASLQREIEELLQFIYLAPVAIIRLGESGAVEMLNPKAVQVLQDLDIDSGRADGPAILDALVPGLGDGWRATAGTVGPVVAPQRCTPKRAQGHPLHLVLQVVRPDARCTMMTIEDVTATVDQERELRRERRRFGLVLEQIHGYCVAMLDCEGVISEWNPSIGRMLGQQAADVTGRPLLDFACEAAGSPHADAAGTPTSASTPTPTPDFKSIAQTVAQQGWCRMQTPWRGLGSSVVWGDCVVTPLIEGDGEVIGHVAVIRDITEEHEQTCRLMDAALNDPLTGLSNRRGLQARIDMAHDRPVAESLATTWIMADIDHFKQVNDRHGHEGGDAVLRAVAAALRDGGRDGDALARFGGEEFVVMLVGADANAGLAVAQRLRQGVEALAIDVTGRTVQVTASFGVAQQAPGERWAAALERADAAMYQAKQAGRNRVVLAGDPARDVVVP